MPGWTDRRVLPAVLFVALAMLWGTWPGAGWSRLAAAAPLGLVALVGLQRWRLALLGLALSAALVLPLLPGGLVDWRPWATALLLVIAFEMVSSPPLADRGASWASTGTVLLILAGVALLLALWRPSHDAIYSPDSLLAGILLVGAAGTVLAILLVTRTTQDA